MSPVDYISILPLSLLTCERPGSPKTIETPFLTTEDSFMDFFKASLYLVFKCRSIAPDYISSVQARLSSLLMNVPYWSCLIFGFDVQICDGDNNIWTAYSFCSLTGLNIIFLCIVLKLNGSRSVLKDGRWKRVSNGGEGRGGGGEGSPCIEA